MEKLGTLVLLIVEWHEISIIIMPVSMTFHEATTPPTTSPSTSPLRGERRWVADHLPCVSREPSPGSPLQRWATQLDSQLEPALNRLANHSFGSTVSSASSSLGSSLLATQEQAARLLDAGMDRIALLLNRPPPPPAEERTEAAALLLMPLSVVIFGATGDLARKKIFPALYQLIVLGLYPRDLNIVACGRSKCDLAEFVARQCVNVAEDPRLSREDFEKRITYHAGGYDVPESFVRLDRELHRCPCMPVGPCPHASIHTRVVCRLRAVSIGILPGTAASCTVARGVSWTAASAHTPMAR